MKNQENVVICPPCGESVAVATKEGQNRKNALWPLLPRLTAVLPPQGREMFRGFTLIELLVVVLIIGILAAVAVPQYQKAVTKSHLAKLKSIVNTLYQARQRYYLEHGNHATRIGDLDIEWGEPDAANPDLHRLDNITCSIYMCATVGQGVGYVIGYMINNSGKRTCVADSRKNTPSKNIPNQVCKAETGRNGNSSATNFDIYFMYTWDY